MNSYKVTVPSSTQVAVGRDTEGNRSATVTQRGGTSMNQNDAYKRALSVANSNMEGMQRQAQRLAEMINARKSVVNPRTGQLDYLHSEEDRKNAMLKLRQLDESMAYQREQALTQAAQAQADADLAREVTAAEYETSAAIDRRASEISFENAAKSLASRLTIKG
jgi:hypothetical protein